MASSESRKHPRVANLVLISSFCVSSLVTNYQLANWSDIRVCFQILHYWTDPGFYKKGQAVIQTIFSPILQQVIRPFWVIESQIHLNLKRHHWSEVVLSCFLVQSLIIILVRIRSYAFWDEYFQLESLNSWGPSHWSSVSFYFLFMRFPVLWGLEKECI